MFEQFSPMLSFTFNTSKKKSVKGSTHQKILSMESRNFTDPKSMEAVIRFKSMVGAKEKSIFFREVFESILGLERSPWVRIDCCFDKKNRTIEV